MKVGASKLFSINNSSWTRNEGVKPWCQQVQLNYTKYFITNDMVRGPPPSMVQFDAINSFKNKIDYHLQQGLW